MSKKQADKITTSVSDAHGKATDAVEKFTNRFPIIAAVPKRVWGVVITAVAALVIFLVLRAVL